MIATPFVNTLSFYTASLSFLRRLKSLQFYSHASRKVMGGRLKFQTTLITNTAVCRRIQRAQISQLVAHRYNNNWPALLSYLKKISQTFHAELFCTNPVATGFGYLYDVLACHRVRVIPRWTVKTRKRKLPCRHCIIITISFGSKTLFCSVI